MRTSLDPGLPGTILERRARAFCGGFEGGECDAAFCGVGPVALETVFREDRLDMALEVHRAGLGEQGEGRQEEEGNGSGLHLRLERPIGAEKA